MTTQYYIAWENHNIFTSREELIDDYIANNYYNGYEDFLERYLCDRYSIPEIFAMSESEKEEIKASLEDELWDDIVTEWDVDIFNINSDAPVTADLERL